MQSFVDRLETHQDGLASKDWVKKVQEDISDLAREVKASNKEITAQFQRIAFRVYLIVGGIMAIGFAIEVITGLVGSHHVKVGP